jgi:Mrp family chromosome partitioning ATPase/capsular polysaccharide biosynthesis protein
MDSTAPAHVPATQSLQDYLAPVWRHKWVVLILAIVVSGGAYLYYSHKPPLYAAATDVYLKTSGAETLVTTNGQPATTDREIANQARVLRSHAVAVRVARRIGFKGDPDALLGAVQVVADPNADFVTIQSQAGTPRGAADLANGFAQAFIDMRVANRRDDAERALRAAKEALAQARGTGPARTASQSEELQNLASQISQLEILRSLPTGSAEQLDPATPPAAPFAPRPKRNAIFAFALSLMFGVLLAFGLDRIDRRIRQLDDVTPAYDAPVIATIPRASERPARTPPPAIPATLLEPFRTLRTSLEIATADAGVRTLLVTSAVAKEGKSTIVRNLALAYRESGKRAVILEADLRKPGLARSLFTPAEPGLTDVLKGKTTLHDALHKVPARLADLSPVAHVNGDGNGSAAHGTSALFPLFLVPCGTPELDPPTMLGTDRFKSLLRHLREEFDMVLIDSPPLLAVSDAVPVLREVDGMVLVSRVGTTTEESAKQLVDLVARVSQTKLLGVVANDVPAGVRSFNYGLPEYAKVV